MRLQSLTLVLVSGVISLLSEGQTQAIRPPNHLAGRNSAYLERASRQLVDWYPLGAEALKRAKELHRPLLIDVGAIWCSWCDLMDRESYARPEVASFINQNFVAVKIDYDADPRLDSRLETAQALANLPAGLPLTILVTPGGILYYGGTYFPAKAAGNKVAFADALHTALRMYRENDPAIGRDGVNLSLEGSSP